MSSESAEAWQEQAEEDWEAAELMHEHGKYGHAAFLYQQAVEKGLKAVLVKKEKGLPQTHDCFFLAKQADAPDIVVQRADDVSPYYFRTRYPDTADISIEKEDVSRVKEAAEEVFTWIEKQC